MRDAYENLKSGLWEQEAEWGLPGTLGCGMK